MSSSTASDSPIPAGLGRPRAVLTSPTSWLVQTIGDREPLHGELGRLYDAIENPRRARGELPILRDAVELRVVSPTSAERTLEVLDGGGDRADVSDPLLR